MEEHRGTKLFERAHGKLSLTENGESFMSGSRKTFGGSKP
jgi:DNA-binding transcriptional LysR family regulator